MIFGLGTDIVEMSRIEKAISANPRFAARILSEFELLEYAKSNNKARYLAKKFAAKEALVKAMGTGIGLGISWQMAQVEHTKNGKPIFVVFDAIKEFFTENNINNCQLSISDETNYALATVILEVC